MRGELILVLVVAFYAGVKCEESAANVASEFIDASVEGGEKHEAQEKDYKMHLQKIDQIKMSQTVYQHQLEESQQQSKMFQVQLRIDNATTLMQLQQQVSSLVDANVQNANKHQTQDKDYANLLLEIQKIKLNLTSNQQQLDASKLQTASLQAQLQSKTATIDMLQRQVSDLSAANVTAAQQIQLLKSNDINQQNQLNVLQQKPAVQWVQWSVNDPIPKDAVFAGQNADSSPMYVGRTIYKGVYSVVKVCPTLRKAFFSYVGQELTITSCEVLTGSDFYWQWGFNSNVPAKVVSVGQSGRYIGRAHAEQSLNPGTIDLLNGAIFVGHSGQEFRFEAYQALVHD